MSSILVTGAAGFIGSNLVENLLADGINVVGLDNMDDFYDPAVKRENIAAALENPAYTFIEGDILDRKNLDDVFKTHEVSMVVHLAARAGVRPSIEDPDLYNRVNVEGTLRLLEAMRTANVMKLCFGSSSSVYGNNEKVPFSETDPVDNPISPYAATKKACELICYTYHHLYQMDIYALRFFTVYGPRQRPEMAIAKFTRFIDEGLEIPLFGDGTSRRDYTYADDILQGVRRAMNRLDEVGGYRIYNLGESETTELGRLVHLIGEALGKEPVLNHMEKQPGDVEITYADISRAKEELGYAPITPVSEGIKLYVEWYKSMSIK